MKLLIATRNKYKLEEIRAIFSILSLEIVSINDYKKLPHVEEDGDTFIANAIRKAATLAITAKVWAMADDSGLAVDALDGAPGVYSARYAGEPADYEANNKKLMKALENISNRKACFHCAIALSNPSGRCQVVEGKCEGSITDSPRGSNGFGYDPLFVPDGHIMTFAEMEGCVKNTISHRALALNLAKEKWEELLTHESGDWPGRELIPG
ncbi:XTP/dITP diphosphatase [Verrucomicrobiota bacterium]